MYMAFYACLLKCFVALVNDPVGDNTIPNTSSKKNHQDLSFNITYIFISYTRF